MVNGAAKATRSVMSCTSFNVASGHHLFGFLFSWSRGSDSFFFQQLELHTVDMRARLHLSELLHGVHLFFTHITRSAKSSSKIRSTTARAIHKAATKYAPVTPSSVVNRLACSPGQFICGRHVRGVVCVSVQRPIATIVLHVFRV